MCQIAQEADRNAVQIALRPECLRTARFQCELAQTNLSPGGTLLIHLIRIRNVGHNSPLQKFVRWLVCTHAIPAPVRCADRARKPYSVPSTASIRDCGS